MRAIQGSRKRPGFLCRARRVVGILVAILTAALGGLLVNPTRAVGHLRERYPPPGELIDVDGRLMHLHCAGTGSPTVVIDAENGSFSLEWTPVQRVLGETTRVGTYDRAGYGWSEAGPERRDGAQAVPELHALLKEAGEEGPFVLVGHSLGGIHAPIYATRDPGEVAALVLVDTMADYTLLPEVQQETQSSLGFYKVMRVITGSGLLRVLGPLGGEGMMPENARKLPDDIRDIYLELVLDPGHETTAIAEVEQLGRTLS